MLVCWQPRGPAAPVGCLTLPYHQNASPSRTREAQTQEHEFSPFECQTCMVPGILLRRRALGNLDVIGGLTRLARKTRRGNTRGGQLALVVGSLPRAHDPCRASIVAFAPLT